MRRLPATAACFALLAALALAAPSVAGKRQRVALGDYEATLNLPTDTKWVQGRFTVAKLKGKRAIVPTEEFGAVYYPDANQCETFSTPLVADRIPISKRGRFKIRERTQADAGDMVVTWTGRWTAPRVVAGKIVIRYGDCVSRLRWTGARAS
jgi:hypothetical protein